MTDLRKFRRGLGDEAQALVAEFFATAIGKALKDAEDINICIRDNYINMYWHGCSILKYAPFAKANRFLIHKKYLPTEPNIDSKATYASLSINADGSDLSCGDCGFQFRRSIIEEPNPNLLKYVEKDGEKKALSALLKAHRNELFLLDLEVAFSRQSEQKEERPVADRADLAFIDTSGPMPRLQLVEVKLDTDARLRSEKAPKIIDQMRRYKEFISRSREEILSSYRQVADNYISLNLEHMVQPSEDSAKVLKDFRAQGEIDPTPYLLIIPHNEERIDKSMLGRKGRDHLARLVSLLQGQGSAFHGLSMRRSTM